MFPFDDVIIYMFCSLRIADGNRPFVDINFGQNAKYLIYLSRAKLIDKLLRIRIRGRANYIVYFNYDEIYPASWTEVINQIDVANMINCISLSSAIYKILTPVTNLRYYFQIKYIHHDVMHRIAFCLWWINLCTANTKRKKYRQQIHAWCRDIFVLARTSCRTNNMIAVHLRYLNTVWGTTLVAFYIKLHFCHFNHSCWYEI